MRPRFHSSRRLRWIALPAARGAAVDYVQRLTARQDRWLRAALRGGDRRLRAVRRSILHAPARYELRYIQPSTGERPVGAPLRGALIGLLVSGLAAGLLIATRRRQAALGSRDGGGPTSAPSSAPPPAWIAGALV